MRLALITDAWFPQVNGVVRTLNTTVALLRAWGDEVLVIEPGLFSTYPVPTYPEIRLALRPGRKVARLLAVFQPQSVHIATEGPLGLAARRVCLDHSWPYTTAYHTRFPEYLRLRAPLPLSWPYRYMRWFHGPAHAIMVPTPSVRARLQDWGMSNLVIWTRGVDTALFRPRPKLDGLGRRPVALYCGRVAVEKNIEAFLTMPFAGSKVVIGSGPALDALRRRYAAVRFLGCLTGESLACYVASADVMVFPSLTDTFGLVMLEAMASGVPVAALPMPGPVDVIENGVNGWLAEDLAEATQRALAVSPAACRAFAERHCWAAATRQFQSHLAVFGD